MIFVGDYKVFMVIVSVFGILFFLCNVYFGLVVRISL